MMLVPSGVRVHIALGVADLRKGLDGLAMLVQGVLEQDPFSGHLFAFRGRFLFHPPHKFRRLDDIAKHRNVPPHIEVPGTHSDR